MFITIFIILCIFIYLFGIPNFETFADLDSAYKVMSIKDKIVPLQLGTRECSREAINKDEFRYIVNLINTHLPLNPN